MSILRAVRQSPLHRLIKSWALDPVRRHYNRIKTGGHIPLAWCPDPNWGDALNPVLVRLLAERPVRCVGELHNERFLVIGSVLGTANKWAEVWGSGFIQDGATVLGKPKAVHAVRGPLSRALLHKQGIECPEVYGDPALLFPRFFDPKVPKSHKVGVIPHSVDKNHPWVHRMRSDPSVLVIDVATEIKDFVISVKSCEVIVSSSLHGLICADSYGVSNVWATLSNHVIGGAFKFRDYRLGIGSGEPTPFMVDENTNLATVVAKAEQHRLDFDFRKLLLSCPFLSPRLRRVVESNSRVESLVAPGAGEE